MPRQVLKAKRGVRQTVSPADAGASLAMSDDDPQVQRLQAHHQRLNTSKKRKSETDLEDLDGAKTDDTKMTDVSSSSAAADAGKEGRAKRQRTKIEPPRYFESPKYGALRLGKGGSSMIVTLGPDATAVYGSRPGVNVPPSMGQLKKAYGKHGWIAGHLLNDNLGGPGLAYNLTPLSGNANKKHSGSIEGPIKAFIIRAKQRSDFNDEDFWVGLKYQVNVQPLTYFGGLATSAITGTVKVIKVDKITRKAEAAKESDFPGGDKQYWKRMTASGLATFIVRNPQS